MAPWWFRIVASVVVSGVVACALPSHPAAAGPCWSPPVDAPIRDPYREPACRWCPGNRGIEFASTPGRPVIAVETGLVTFSGDVAGRSYVVVEHRDGLRATYGGLADRQVGRNHMVVRGQRIGSTSGSFHFGLRRAGNYLDPTPYLGRWVGRARLLPVDGSPAAVAPPPRLRCGAQTGANVFGRR